MRGPDIDLEMVRQAWRDATDGEVVLALRHAHDYPADAFTVVREEADRRHLNADSTDAIVEPPATVVAQAGRFAAGFATRVIIPVYRFLHARPYGSAVVFGLLIAALNFYWPRSFTWAGWNARPFLVIMAHIAVAALLCWPLRKHDQVWKVAAMTLFSRTCFDLVAVALTTNLLKMLTRESILRFVVMLIITTALIAGPLSIVVHIRNRYWPVREPGRCRHCGYDLRFLPLPRCPECGTPFEYPAEAADSDALQQSAPDDQVKDS